MEECKNDIYFEDEDYISAMYSIYYCASCLAMFEEECCCDCNEDEEF